MIDYDSRDNDIEKLLFDVYVSSDGEEFFQLPDETRESYIKHAKTDNGFAALNYLYTKKNIEKVASYITNTDNHTLKQPGCDYSFYKSGENYIFKLSTTIAVSKSLKKTTKINETIKRLMHELKYDVINEIDLEFFETHYGTEGIIKSWVTGDENFIDRLYANEYKLERMVDYEINDKKYGKFTAKELISNEELELINNIKNGRISKEKLTTFADKEKIHFKLLTVKERTRKAKSKIIPYFIGIGNNYPFTRLLQEKNRGDDRFYRESLVNNEFYQIQKYVLKNEKWEYSNELSSHKDTLKKLKTKLENPDLEFKKLKTLLDYSQQNYNSYFNQVHNLDEKIEKFEKKRNIKLTKEEKNRNARLMLNPKLRLGAAAVVAYSHLQNLRS